MLRARIRKTFPPRQEAAGFTLDLDLTMRAPVSVLLGPSGSGKTLTLDSIAGFMRPDEGRILLSDEILFDSKSSVHLPPQQRHCGYVFQRYALFPHMTLRANLDFAAQQINRGLDRHRRVSEMIERFRLTAVAGLRPGELSGGQKQRCSIARALIAEPRILLLDEPSQGLDTALRIELYTVLRQVQSEFKTPILLVTHDLEECFELGEEVFIIRGGRLVQQGAPREVLGRPASAEVAELVGHRNILAAQIVALDPGRNSSVLKIDDFEMRAPYLPGYLIGDRLSVFIRATDLKAWPRGSSPGKPRLVVAGAKGIAAAEDEGNQIPATLERVVELPHSFRLEFSGGLTVDMAGTTPPVVETTGWIVSFPPESIHPIRP